MKESVRAKRMARHHARMHRPSGINLTSLIDILTLLVFFSIVNSAEVQVLHNNEKIKLPESIVEKKPKDTITLAITDTDIIVQGRKIADVKDAMTNAEIIIPQLSAELEYQTSRRPVKTAEEETQGRSIIIMGDRKIPYALLKRVMTTCAKADYSNIALAVTQISQATQDAKRG